MTEAFILGGVRTPVGRYGGSLSHVRTDDLLGRTMVAACERVGVALDRIEDISAGCVNPAHEGMGDIARWGALAAGFPDSVPAVTVNRFCASSLTGAISIAHAIRSGELGVGLAAGVESMSRSGWATMKGDAPFSPRGPVLVLDTMWAGAGGPPNPTLLARNAYVEMIKTAQNVADHYELTREEIDAFALRSHRHAAAARDSGRLAAEIHPVEIAATRKEPARTFGQDEMIRGDTTAEQLAALPPQPNTTQMTAGNSSPLSDGASAVVLAGDEAARALGLEPLARVVASATHALDPQMMGIAPAFAMATALNRARLTPADIDVWEVHEAFAAQALGVLRELPRQLGGFVVPDDRLNPNGGAVAIGHPFGSSGTRYVLTLATELRLRDLRYGILGSVAQLLRIRSERPLRAHRRTGHGGGGVRVRLGVGHGPLLPAAPLGGPDQPMLEAYTLLGALAARTQRVQLGTLVTGVTYRNPGILAKIVTTLDIVSRGRAILGIGGAWYDVEHQGLGVDYPSDRVRLDMLEEAVQVCRAMFTGDDVSFTGTHYRLDHARNLPRPVQAGGPKIMIGGGGEKRTLRLVAKLRRQVQRDGRRGHARPQDRGAPSPLRRSRP
jgi:acetyl-CoA acetyltransferase family protein